MEKLLATRLLIVGMFLGLATHACRQSVTVARETPETCTDNDACDDDDSCTLNDQCQAGTCVGQPNLEDILCHPLVCNRHGWCWESPRPQSNDLNAVIAFASTDIWAAGDAGTILHFNETHWELHDTGTDSDLNAIGGTSPDDIWSAGADGTLLHWDGSRWNPMPSDTSLDLKGLFVDSIQNLWVVGQSGFVGLWALGDEKLQAMTSPSNEDLFSVWRPADSFIWAVGSAETMITWDGSKWNERLVPYEGIDFIDIWGTDVFNVWATSTNEVIHITSNMVWTIQSPSISGPVRAIHGSSSADVWAMGTWGNSWHWKGASWTPHQSKDYSDYTDVFALDAKQAWAVGQRGASFTLENGAWKNMSANVSKLRAVTAACSVTEEDIWIASVNPTGIQHYDGRQLVDFQLDDDASIFALWCLASDQVWAVGPQGKLRRWQGESWTNVPSPSTEHLNGVWGSGDTIWAVGNNGTILNWQETRGSWLAEEALVEQKLNGVFGSAPDDVWVVGGLGVLLHFDGIAWRSLASPTIADLSAVWASSKNDVWITSIDGSVYYWDGSDWEQQLNSGISQYAIWGLGPDDIWTAGSGGSVFRFDGNNWQRVPSGARTITFSDILVMPRKIIALGHPYSILYLNR